MNQNRDTLRRAIDEIERARKSCGFNGVFIKGDLVSGGVRSGETMTGDEFVDKVCGTKIKPCPFCGCTTPEAINPSDGACFVVCPSCECRSVVTLSEAHAIDAWNVRSGGDG